MIKGRKFRLRRKKVKKRPHPSFSLPSSNSNPNLEAPPPPMAIPHPAWGLLMNSKNLGIGLLQILDLSLGEIVERERERERERGDGTKRARTVIEGGFNSRGAISFRCADVGATWDATLVPHQELDKEGGIRARQIAKLLNPPTKPMSPSQPRVQSQGPATKAKVEGGVTFEYQRKMAKEMQDHFKQKKLEEADQGPFFGFLGKNEIANGRWAMFGFAVGLLTEYATGADFVQQLKILLSNFGIVDLD